MTAPGLANWLRVIALSIIWGGAFVNTRLALADFPPLTIAGLRIALAAAAVWALMRVMGQRLPTNPRVWAFAAAMGVFSNALPFSLLAWAQQHVASGFAGITMATVPLFTLLLAVRFVPGEVLTPARLVGVALGLTGVVLLIGPQALLTRSGADHEMLARIACVATTLAYAIGSITTRRCPPTPLVSLSAASLIMATLVMIPLVLAVDGVPDVGGARASSLAGLIYLGLMPTALATVLMVAVIQQAGPTFLTMSNYQVPIWSVIFGALIFGERLPASFFIALGLILAGLAVSNLRRRTRPV